MPKEVIVVGVQPVVDFFCLRISRRCVITKREAIA